jgi:hypothetical protein
MRIRTCIGPTLTLIGILLLVVANGRGKQIAGSQGAPAESGSRLSAPSPSPAFSPVIRQPSPADSPTIFEALLGVLDSTDDGGTLDKEQRDQLRRNLVDSSQVWRGMKEEMKESILRANQRFTIAPNQDLPNLPAP